MHLTFAYLTPRKFVLMTKVIKYVEAVIFCLLAACCSRQLQMPGRAVNTIVNKKFNCIYLMHARFSHYYGCCCCCCYCGCQRPLKHSPKYCCWLWSMRLRVLFALIAALTALVMARRLFSFILDFRFSIFDFRLYGQISVYLFQVDNMLTASAQCASH